MGYVLSNTFGGTVRFSSFGWDLSLTVAQFYGWRPAGTLPPTMRSHDDGDWNGGYSVNGRQMVRTEDALAIAEALKRAIAAANFVQVIHLLIGELNELASATDSLSRPEIKPLTDEEAERFRSRLVELAAFARQGAFIIE